MFKYCTAVIAVLYNCELNILDVRKAALDFPAAKPLLRRAASSEYQPASGSGFPAPHGRKTVRVGRPSKKGETIGKAAHDVPGNIVLPGGAQRAGNVGKYPDTLLKPLGFIHGVV